MSNPWQDALGRVGAAIYAASMMVVGQDKSRLFQHARKTFDAYATMDAPKLPVDRLSALQVLLDRQQPNGVTAHAILTCMTRGLGDLAHDLMEYYKPGGVREDMEAVREDVSMALREILSGCFLLASCFRLDVGVLMEGEVSDPEALREKADRLWAEWNETQKQLAKAQEAALKKPGHIGHP